MRSNLTFIFLIAFVFAGCASNRLAIKPTASSTSVPTPTPPEPPVLNSDQLLGLQRPPGLIRDTESAQYAQQAVMESFWKLKAKAAQDGWHLILVSGYRSFYQQRHIWNHFDSLYKKTDNLDEKGRVRAIMSLVSVPGLSRHHWGTELDISEVSLRGQLVNVHPDTPAKVIAFYNWMEQNAPQFGFCKVYLGKRGAVRDEPWHWSYMPFSRVYQPQFMAIKDFHQIMSDKVSDVGYLMKNFPKILKQEIRSINSECFSQGPAANSPNTPTEIEGKEKLPPAPKAAEGAD
ncbi:MAG TPA: M15 family metallopeptidase [bacterium]|jgi:D-alanyl-D-alanine carboxypeptidase|nr:M15 family metallopeptidase [bacterium]